MIPHGKPTVSPSRMTELTAAKLRAIPELEIILSQVERGLSPRRRSQAETMRSLIDRKYRSLRDLLRRLKKKYPTEATRISAALMATDLRAQKKKQIMDRPFAKHKPSEPTDPTSSGPPATSDRFKPDGPTMFRHPLDQ